MRNITYGFFENGFVDPGYVVEYLGSDLEFVYNGSTALTLTKGFGYSPNRLVFLQSTVVTAANFPMRTSPVLSQMTVDATFPYLNDTDTVALRNFMFTTVPLFDIFTLKFVGKDYSRDARFTKRSFKVTQVIKNFNQVTVPITFI